MNTNKEADLATAILVYAMRCLVEGDQHALRAMRFGPDEVAALRDLNLADLYRVDSLQAHCLDVRLDRAVFWPMVRHLRETRESEEMQRDLLRVDAPLEMMADLFGMSPREYTRLRRLLAVEPAVGRPAEPDDQASCVLWDAWCTRVKHDAPRPLEPDDYLALHEETGVSMRAVWNASQRWLAYGESALSRAPTGDQGSTASESDGRAASSPPI